MNGLAFSSVTRNSNTDEFLTPKNLIRNCLWLLTRNYDREDVFTVLDPGANLGQWGDVLREYFPNAYITGVEIMDLPKPASYDEWVVGDFLRWHPETTYDVVIGNPPYSVRYRGKREVVAERFVRHSLELLNDKGWAYLLLRTGWAASRTRLWKDRDIRTKPGIHQMHHYLEEYHVTPRPSFYAEDSRTEQYGTTKTNAHEYALFTWAKGWWPTFGFSRHLDWEYDRQVSWPLSYGEWIAYMRVLDNLGIPFNSYGLGVPCDESPEETLTSGV